jgi:hypothetical protein
MREKTKKKLSYAFFNMDVFTPGGFYIRALGILLVFLLLDVTGIREYAMLLSGTSPTGDPESMVTHLWAVLYILFYLGAVVLTPILLLASAILRVLLRFF